MVSREFLTVSLGKDCFFFFYQVDTTSGNLGRRCLLFRLGRSVGISVGIVLITPTEMETCPLWVELFPRKKILNYIREEKESWALMFTCYFLLFCS